MEGNACGYKGLHMGGIGCYSKWVPGSAGTTTPGVPLAQSFNRITCFGRAFRVKGTLVVMTYKVFFWFG